MSRLVCLTVLPLVLLAAVQRTAAAQADATTESPAPSKPAVGDSSAAKIVDQARAAVDRGDYADAAVVLNAVLDSDERLVVRDPANTKLFRSLADDAERTIREAPAEFRAFYEREFGPRAAERLRQARQAGDFTELEQVQRRFLYTKAGAEAAYLLALRSSDAGDPLAASLSLERLLRRQHLEPEFERRVRLRLALAAARSGRQDRARRLLAELGDPRLRVAGGPALQVPATEFLERLGSSEPFGGSTWHGSVAGVSSSATERPFPEATTLAAVEDEFVRTAVAALQRGLNDRGVGRVPAARPVFVDGALVYRLPDGIVAVDLESSEVRWRVRNESPSLDLFGVSDPTTLSDAVRDRRGLQRLFHDVGFGALSTDGRLVFAVESVAFDVGTDRFGLQPADTFQAKPGVPAQPVPRGNSLAAYDARSGKLVWQIGRTVDGETPALKGGRFVGPPMPLFQRLYAVVDFADGTSLVRLDASGKVLDQWIVGLREPLPPAPAQYGGPREPSEPVGVAPPVLAGTLAICPTPSREFAAVDVLDGSTRWVFGLGDEEEDGPLAVRRRKVLEQGLVWQPDRWVADEAVVAGDSVVLVSNNATELIALDLESGVKKWSVSSGRGSYVVPRSDDLLLVVGRLGVRGLRVSDGGTVWESPGFPDYAVPSGRGVFVGDDYAVPLSSGRIAFVDVRTGRPNGIAVGSLSGPLGSLVVRRDRLFSSGVDGVRRLATIETLPDESPTPESRPDDVTLAGRVALAKGEPRQALAELERVPEADRNAAWSAAVLRAVSEALRETPGEAEDVLSKLPELTDVALAERVGLAEELLDAGLNDEARALVANADPVRAGEVVTRSGVSNRVRLGRRVAALQRRVGVASPPAPVDWSTSLVADTSNGRYLDAKLSAKAENMTRDPRKPQQDVVAPVTMVGPRPVGGRVTYDWREHVLRACDDVGRGRLSLRLPTPPPAGNSVYLNSRVTFFHGVERDGVLLLHRLRDVVAVDTRADPPVVLWTRSVAAGSDETLAQQNLWAQVRKQAGLQWVWGQTVPLSVAAEPRLLAPTGDGVCFWTRGELVCVEPRSADVLWARNDVGPCSDLLTDERRLVVTPVREVESTLVVDAFDGSFVDRRPSRPLASRVGTSAGLALHRIDDEKGGVARLELRDPYENEVRWSETIPEKAVVCASGDRVLVVAPDGALRGLDYLTGDDRFTTKVPVPKQLEGAHLVRFDGGRGVLVLQSPPGRLAYGAFSVGEVSVSGKLVGLDLDEGLVKWQRDVEGLKVQFNQLRGLPVFVAANRYQKPKPRKGGGVSYDQPVALLQCLDVRDGRVLEDSRPRSTYGASFRLRFDSEQRSLAVETAVRRVTIRLEQSE